MADPKKPEEFVQFKYSYPVDKKFNGSPLDRLRVSAHIGHTALTLDFTNNKEGHEALALLIRSMPQVLMFIYAEIDVKREISGLDQELEQLLNPEGDAK